MKDFNGKAIYQPAGKAAEYAQWACNFYVGCSNGCTYCYLKKGRGAAILGGDVPTLKKCFRDETHALEVFEKELKANLPKLQRHGLFFSFTTDPMLENTAFLTLIATLMCVGVQVPVKILTKCSRGYDVFKAFIESVKFKSRMSLIAFGFTLTGHDELETGASTNAERIESMKKLHDAGFKTWASIEPIIDFETSYNMILATRDFCDLYKIGLQSGYKCQNGVEKERMIRLIDKTIDHALTPIYFKDSLLKAAGIERSELPDNCVDRDYNMFKEVVKLTKSEFLKQVKGNVINPSAEPQPGAYDLNGVDGFCDKNELKKARQ